MTKHSFTSDQVLEVVRCIDPVTGPAYFIEHYFFVQCSLPWPVHVSMHPYVLDYLHNMHSNQMSINMMSRQLGKTIIAVGYALWVALFVRNSNIAIASISYSMAKDILARIQYAISLLPPFLAPAIRHQTQSTVEFDIGSRIGAYAMTPNFGRGMSISLLLIDELAYARKEIAREFFIAAIPAIAATRGKIIATSSFSSADNMFQDLWDGATAGKNDYSTLSATWKDCPNRDDAWADNQRKVLGQTIFSTEHENRAVLEEVS